VHLAPLSRLHNLRQKAVCEEAKLKRICIRECQAIQDLKSALNVQSDSLRAKVFM